MNATKNFFAGFFIALILSCVEVVHAEEIDPYFLWEIKNLDDYQKCNALFKEVKDNENLDIREEIYNRIKMGRYFEAAMFCRTCDTY